MRVCEVRVNPVFNPCQRSRVWGSTCCLLARDPAGYSLPPGGFYLAFFETVNRKDCRALCLVRGFLVTSRETQVNLRKKGNLVEVFCVPQSWQGCRGLSDQDPETGTLHKWSCWLIPSLSPLLASLTAFESFFAVIDQLPLFLSPCGRHGYQHSGFPCYEPSV